LGGGSVSVANPRSGRPTTTRRAGLPCDTPAGKFGWGRRESNSHGPQGPRRSKLRLSASSSTPPPQLPRRALLSFATTVCQSVAMPPCLSARASKRGYWPCKRRYGSRIHRLKARFAGIREHAFPDAPDCVHTENKTRGVFPRSLREVSSAIHRAVARRVEGLWTNPVDNWCDGTNRTQGGPIDAQSGSKKKRPAGGADRFSEGVSPIL
jgi:hypothetical protein